MVNFQTVDSDSQLKDFVRAETQYENINDELVDTDLDTIIDGAKMKVYLETGSESWYTDIGLGFALLAYSKMRAKAAMENFAIEGYELGDQSVTTRNADPEDNQQIQQWADDVSTGLDNSDLDLGDKDGRGMSNTSDYIGEQYIPKHDDQDSFREGQ